MSAMDKVFPATILLISATVSLQFGVREKIFIFLMAGFLALASYTDIRELKIPNKLNLAFSLTMTFAGLLLDFLGSSGNFPRGLALGALSFLTFMAMHLIYPAGLGMGDVKLAFGIGFCLGWFSFAALVSGFLAALLLNGVISVILLLFSSKQVSPFAPALGAGSLIGLTYTL